MKNQRFYGYTALSLVFAIGTVLAIHNLSIHSGIVAGVAALASIGFYELAEKQANRTGKDKRTKITLSISQPAYEILILGAVLATNIVPVYLAISVISAVLLSQLVEEKIINKLRQSIQPRFGQRTRVGVTVLTLFLSALNQLYIFYGMWIVGIIAIYDLSDIIYRSIRN